MVQIMVQITVQIQDYNSDTTFYNHVVFLISHTHTNISSSTPETKKYI